MLSFCFKSKCSEYVVCGKDSFFFTRDVKAENEESEMELEQMPPPHITYAHIILHGIASVVNSILYPPLLPYKYKDVTVQIAQKLEGVVSLALRKKTQKSF